MKFRVLAAVLAVSLAAVLPVFAAGTGATQTKTVTPSKAPMHDGSKQAAAQAGGSTYVVISPHSPEECLAALDAVSQGGNEALSKWEWGCQSGDHTGYQIVKASSESEALKVVPESVRAKARAIKVARFDAAEIRALHQQHG
jgi:hypothetical protein